MEISWRMPSNLSGLASSTTNCQHTFRQCHPDNDRMLTVSKGFTVLKSFVANQMKKRPRNIEIDARNP